MKKSGLDNGFAKANGLQNINHSGAKMPTGGQRSPSFGSIAAKDTSAHKAQSHERVPGGKTTQGLRTAHTPANEAGAVSHVKKHIC